MTYCSTAEVGGCVERWLAPTPVVTAVKVLERVSEQASASPPAMLPSVAALASRCGATIRRQAVLPRPSPNSQRGRNAELRRVIRQLQIDKRNLATENLSLLHRARLAEDLLARPRPRVRCAQGWRAAPMYPWSDVARS
jgi:hypothetical protein